MRLRTPLLLVLAVFVGLSWSLRSNVHVVLAHLIVPPVVGVAVATFWLALAWRRQLLLLAGFLAVAELVRLLMYSLRANGWRYITTDSETQLWLVASFAVQVIVALAAWTAASLFVRRNGRPLS